MEPRALGTARSSIELLLQPSSRASGPRARPHAGKRREAATWLPPGCHGPEELPAKPAIGVHRRKPSPSRSKETHTMPRKITMRPTTTTQRPSVVFCMDRALEFAPACHRFKILKAECLAMLGRYPEAQSVASDILRLDSTNADALYVRGLCLYYEDCIEKAVQFFVQALRMAPDHEKACAACRNAKALKAKKEDGNKAFKDGNYKLAYELYTEALAIDPNNIKTNAKLYCNRGTVNSKLRKLDEAIADCTRAVTLDDTYIKAYLRRAQCYMDTEQYEDAVRDYEKVYQTEKTKEHKQLLKNAQLELKKSKRKDYYKILGVDKNASEDEIKRAYRKRALMHHPDRHSGASAEVQKEEEKKFKEVGEAFTILSDPKKKTRYDSGQDLDEEGMNMGDFDANNIFKAFFGGPGGFSFEASGPGNFFFQFG
ncbi:PREDICTED: dnaJ homolog subfamily C member 7 isoform X3 [Chinchilla lanigera]|uniref:dnaJ homolog subfamily C member 7 isoform X3 n=1 Tax=Chinchilla lanigera TaxID=34839 RepID=UPI0006989251|nr:PREDICTED: dnaJ homolog subfamily C member 7 isoform X3 [Chinchilla lanigera]